MTAGDVRGETLTGPELFDVWREFALHGACPAELRTERPEDFTARDRAVALGSVEVSATSAGGLEVRRTARLVRACDPEMWVVHVPLRGEFAVVSDGRHVQQRPGTVMVISTSQPYTLLGDRDYAGVKAYLPRGLLPVPEHVVRRTLSAPLTGRAGFGSLLTEFLLEVAAPGAAHRPEEAARLGTALIDLSAALLASHGDAERALPVEHRHGALFLRAQHFARRRLADPRLAPATVAAALGISLRLLQQIFRAHGLGVAEWIRTQRLERCRRELADPARAAVPAHRIAARWGFGRPEVFTRAFRAEFGTTPAEYRALARTHALHAASPSAGRRINLGCGASPETATGRIVLPAPRRPAGG